MKVKNTCKIVSRKVLFVINARTPRIESYLAHSAAMQSKLEG